MKLDGGSSIEIEWAHRTPGSVSRRSSAADKTINNQQSRSRPRPILCKLLRYADRQYILKNAARCLKNNPSKGANIYISDDVTNHIRNTWKELRENHLPGIRRDEQNPSSHQLQASHGQFKSFRLGGPSPF